MQQVSAEKRKPPVVRAEQETLSLVNMIEDLTMSDSVAQSKMPSKAERAKSKGENHKGTKRQKLLSAALMCHEVLLLWFSCSLGLVGIRKNSRSNKIKI